MDSRTSRRVAAGAADARAGFEDVFHSRRSRATARDHCLSGQVVAAGARFASEIGRRDRPRFGAVRIAKRIFPEGAMIDKTVLRNTLLGLEAERLAYSERAYAQYLRGSARDYSEP